MNSSRPLLAFCTFKYLSAYILKTRMTSRSNLTLFEATKLQSNHAGFKVSHCALFKFFILYLARFLMIIHARIIIRYLFIVLNCFWQSTHYTHSTGTFLLTWHFEMRRRKGRLKEDKSHLRLKPGRPLDALCCVCVCKKDRHRNSQCLCEYLHTLITSFHICSVLVMPVDFIVTVSWQQNSL